jgi:hypothetical protein
MILDVHFRERLWRIENEAQIERVVDEVMVGLAHEDKVSPWVDAGDVAMFFLSDSGYEQAAADNLSIKALQASVNLKSGFGGLVWFVTGIFVRKDALSNYIWVSDSPEPPEFDPRVVGDPGIPVFFDRKSAIPVKLVRAALKEFCKDGNGARPTCIQWVRGEMDGTRHEVLS